MEDLKKAENEEKPVDIECPECGEIYIGWAHQKGDKCFDCFACDYFKKRDNED